MPTYIRELYTRSLHMLHIVGYIRSIYKLRRSRCTFFKVYRIVISSPIRPKVVKQCLSTNHHPWIKRTTTSSIFLDSSDVHRYQDRGLQCLGIRRIRGFGNQHSYTASAWDRRSHTLQAGKSSVRSTSVYWHDRAHLHYCLSGWK